MTCFTGRRETHYYKKRTQRERRYSGGRGNSKIPPEEETQKQDKHMEHLGAGQEPKKGDSALQEN